MKATSTIMLDTNLWSSIGDDCASSDFDALVRSRSLQVMVAPSTLMEVARHPVPQVRQRIISALARYPRGRLSTEAEVESAEVVAEIRRLRPQWMRTMPDTAKAASLHTFWTRRIWRAAVQDAQRIHDHEAAQKPIFDAAVALQKKNRSLLLQGNLSMRPLTALLASGSAEVAARCAQGWNGDPIEAWRLDSRMVFWQQLVEVVSRAPFTAEDTTFADWVGAYVDLAAVRSDPIDFTRFWFEEVALAAVPRQWIRWAVDTVQTDRKVTGGNPADQQHSSYLLDCDVFLSADAAFVAVLQAVREDAPFSLAEPRLVRGDRTIPIMERLRAVL
ncbi:hypothetical protein [Nocardia suismassiliense]|uniref:hypothetical protein n=1 Tax=Nocardia suismassiliense TaxID=2077092 RepID=UPI00131F0FA3|nr:hypothetical protein [Nocardia suismassiliense]